MDEKEDALIAFNVSIIIKKRIETRAEKLGLNTSNYMRFLAMRDLDEAEKAAKNNG